MPSAESSDSLSDTAARGVKSSIVGAASVVQRRQRLLQRWNGREILLPAGRNFARDDAEKERGTLKLG